MEEDYDCELYELVDTLNSRVGCEVARVVENAEAVFKWVELLIPRVNNQVDWTHALISSGPTQPDGEPAPEKIARIVHDYERFVELAELKLNDWVTFLSDEFYTKGLECQVSIGTIVLKKWLELPHAIFLVANNRRALHFIAFVRSSYVFLPKT